MAFSIVLLSYGRRKNFSFCNQFRQQYSSGKILMWQPSYHHEPFWCNKFTKCIVKQETKSPNIPPKMHKLCRDISSSDWPWKKFSFLSVVTWCPNEYLMPSSSQIRTHIELMRLTAYIFTYTILFSLCLAGWCFLIHKQMWKHKMTKYFHPGDFHLNKTLPAFPISFVAPVRIDPDRTPLFTTFGVIGPISIDRQKGPAQSSDRNRPTNKTRPKAATLTRYPFRPWTRARKLVVGLLRPRGVFRRCVLGLVSAAARPFFLD